MLTVLNYLLILAVAVLSASGLFFRGAGDAFDVLGWMGIVPPAAVLAIILWRAFRTQPKDAREPGTLWFMWLAALVLVSREIFTSRELQDIYVMILIMAVLLPALVRAGPVWMPVFAFAVAGYSAQMAVEEGILAGTVDISAFYEGLLQFAAVLFLSGLVPWWILRKRAEARERQFNTMLEEVRNNAITDAMARTRELADPARKPPTQTVTSSIATGTLRFSSGDDTLSLLAEGGDQVNMQLKSMLFFIRYNVKGLTACAFIYDGPSRSLVLNCYDTKSGVTVLDNTRIPFGGGLIGQAATGRNVIVSGDMSLYQNKEQSYYAAGQEQNACSIMAAPVLSERNDKDLLGVLVVDSPNKNAFSDHDKEIMKRFASIAAALMDNIMMSIKLEQSDKISRVYYDVSHNFSTALKMDDIFSVLVEWVPKITPSCTRLIVVLHDQANNTLRLHLVAGARAELAEGMEFSPRSGGMYSYAFNSGKPVSIPDLQAQKSYRFVPEETPNPTTRSLLILPIGAGEGSRCVVALFSIESSLPDLFRSDAKNEELEGLAKVLNTITDNASVALARAMLYQKMETLATTDGLTGLNNHRTFQERMAAELERSRRYGRPLSLLLTDIDHFKSFNDTYGHPVGDLVLREISGCIRNAVRINDIPARYGGEEFAVILPETDENGAYITAEKIRQMVEAKVIESGSNKLRVTISIGCVTFPTYGTTQQEIIDCSDKALYTSKRSGRNRVTIYDPSMTVASK
ncbi:MAG: diguanylate cyclase [Chitinispirillia bacterium]|nr:diguanylate cyclase [Chitinispirillia bacterium]MCL2242668.1 diguanylate cyclase [Chitinispirillia bacterium]